MPIKIPAIDRKKFMKKAVAMHAAAFSIFQRACLGIPAGNSTPLDRVRCHLPAGKKPWATRKSSVSFTVFS